MRVWEIQFGRVARWIGVAIAFGLITSCNPFSRDRSDLPEDIEITERDGQKQIENTVENIQLTAPDSWEIVETLRPDAEIYVADEAEELYVLVLAEDPNTNLDLFGLSDNAQLYRELLTERLDDDNEISTTTTAIQDKPAEQYEIRGNIDGSSVVYLHTTVRGDNKYYQVIGWTGEEQYNTEASTLRDVILSFTETPPQDERG